jgi:hypothetical protein
MISVLGSFGKRHSWMYLVYIVKLVTELIVPFDQHLMREAVMIHVRGYSH